MRKTFLTAHWKNLIMANYACNADVLKKYLPAKTEFDIFSNICYVSLVGFLFQDTKVMGIGFPFHRNFEEINLRFYVRYKENEIWKRGVVFIKEIVPRRMIATIANSFYHEKYITLPTKHRIENIGDLIQAEYAWRFRQKWNFITVKAENELKKIDPGTEEEFITEHYWGYTAQKNNTVLEYAVEHPRWEIYTVQQHYINCDFEGLYGKDFLFLQSEKPLSVFLAKGSDIIVRKGKIIT